MDHRAQPELLYGIDRLVVSGRRVFGWGWVAHEDCAVRSVAMRADAEGARISVDFGLAREDVAKAFPNLRGGDRSGFVATGFTDRPAGRLWLDVELDDGRASTIEVSASAERRYGQKRTGSRLAWIAAAVWRRLRRGDIAGILRRARAQSYTAASLDDETTLRALLAELAGEPSITVIIDHNMGGGANHYREREARQRLAAGRAVLLFTYVLPTLDYRLNVLRPGRAERTFRLGTFAPLERAIASSSVQELFVNSPVSFDEPLVLAEWLARMRQEHPGLRLVVTAHDFFAVCPSFVLLDADGRYCGIPELSRCEACLRRHRARYVALSPPTAIGPWRAIWGRALGAADEVRCFSVSTRELLRRAYPALDPERITVVPHRIDFSPARLPRLDATTPLVIGIVGEISAQKGAGIVVELLRILEREHPQVRVVVIGSLDAAERSPNLTVTGPYRKEELVDLVESHGANMFLFPSIWPETFSYVVAELMALRVPLVAFDLGAPAERLRGYPLGRVCGETSARAALQTILDFHRERGQRPAAVR